MMKLDCNSLLAETLSVNEQDKLRLPIFVIVMLADRLILLLFSTVRLLDRSFEADFRIVTLQL
jgi:hypothetical protein